MPTPEATTAGLDCVVGNSAADGKWSVFACTATGTGKFGSICERDDEPTSTSAPAPTPDTSGSTSLKSGTAVVIGSLLLLL